MSVQVKGCEVTQHNKAGRALGSALPPASHLSMPSLQWLAELFLLEM